MSTKHILLGERVYNPSRQQIRRIVGKSHVASKWPGIRPGYLYTVVRAISARVNQNYDGWPSAELKEAAHTFVGKPVFVNHENFDPETARGVVVAARYVENGRDKYIETVMEIDAKRFPLLAGEISTGGLDSVSMGAEAGFTVCSACGNRAADEDEFCEHVAYHKGDEINVRNRRTGKTERKLVYESCHKLSFFELSYVFDPADETAVASKVLVASLRKTASECPPGAPCDVMPDPKGLPPTAYPHSSGAGTEGTGSGATPATLGTPGAGGSPAAAASGHPDGGPPSTSLTQALQRAGVDPAMYPMISGFSATEGNNPEGAPTLGFKDTQAGTTLDSHAQALAQQIQDRASVSGPFPHSGSPADQASWMATTVGQNSVPSDFAGERQPPRADYVNNIVKNMPSTPAATTPATSTNSTATGISPSSASPGGNSTTGVQPTQPTQPTTAMVRAAVLAKLGSATDDYLEWAKKIDSGEATPERSTAPATEPPSRALSDWAARSRKREVARKQAADFAYPPAQNSQKTQVSNTGGTYGKAHAHFDAAGAPQGKILDYGAGLGHSAQYGDTFEPHPREGFSPTHTDATAIPDGSYNRLTNLNVLNVVPPDVRDGIVKDIGRVMAPGGHAVITTRGRDVMDAKGTPGPEPMSMIVGQGNNARYQKGFTRPELHQYVQNTLGPNYTVKPVPLGPAGVHVVRNAGRQANLRSLVRTAALKKMGWGEVEAPTAVNTLREEGSAPEDDNNDWEHYVDSPDELSMPDTSEAAQIDREQAEDAAPEQQAVEGGQPAGPPPPPGGGGPGAGMPPDGGAPPEDPGQFMTLKIPMPQEDNPAQVVPQHVFASNKRVSLRTLAWMERYYGYRIADWRDAIEAGRSMSALEHADFRREAALLTLENGSADSTTGRNTVKGTASMARSTLATRRRTAGNKHFAEGPLTDGGDVSRNDEGEQEEAFITSVPAPEPVEAPTDDTPNIDNTEDNLVADEGYAHELTSRLRHQKQQLEATAREYARVTGRGGRRTAELDDDSDVGYAAGPVPTEVNPEVTNPAAERLTGDNFDSADPNPTIDTSVAGPGTTTLPIESSLQAFQTFDRWLHRTTGKHVRAHSEVNIKRAARQFAAHNKMAVQGLFPALGIALREARKTEAAKKGAKMRRRAVDLETAAPDERVSVPAPVADTTDAEAQASQFDESGWDDNAGKDVTDPDLGTGQNWAPGQAPKESRKQAKADGILAIRCAEAMIAAGLESNTRERKYALAGEFQKMSRGLILDRVALAERFAMVRQADHQAAQQRVASGRTRGTALPPGFTQGGAPTQRTASHRQAANDPDNDSLLYG